MEEAQGEVVEAQEAAAEEADVAVQEEEPIPQSPLSKYISFVLCEYRHNSTDTNTGSAKRRSSIAVWVALLTIYCV